MYQKEMIQQVVTKEDIKNALLNRYSEEEVNKFLILGKDISKRGIPIYKELT